MINIKARIKAAATRAKGAVLNALLPDKPDSTTSDRFDSDLKRCRRLTESHQRLVSLFGQFAETSKQHIDIGLKIQSELRDVYEASNRSECLEEFVCVNDIRTGLLEQYQRLVNACVDPFLEALLLLNAGSSTSPGLEEVKKAMTSCTDAMANMARLRKAIQASAPTNDAPLSQSVKNLENSLEKNLLHSKATQELADQEATYPQLESAFEQVMDDYEALKSFTLLKQLDSMMNTSLIAQRTMLKLISPMEDYLVSELPATITQYVEEYDRTKSQREQEVQRLRQISLAERNTSRPALIAPSEPALLAGETLLLTADNVINLSDSENATTMVYVTTFRVVLVPYNPPETDAIDVPLSSIVRVEAPGGPNGLLCLWTIDLRQFMLAFFKSSTEVVGVVDALRYLCFKRAKVFAFFYEVKSRPPEASRSRFTENEAQQWVVSSKEGVVDPGWLVYDPLREARRQGLLGPLWRVSKLNDNFALCPTYPELLVFPKGFSDSEVQEASEHRTKARLPVVCWKAPWGKHAIFRGSQPRLGVTRARRKADERLLFYYGAITQEDNEKDIQKFLDTRMLDIKEGNDFEGRKLEGGSPQPTLQSLRHFCSPLISLVIFDARPQKNAVGNLAKGGGWEIAEYYQNCVCIFLDIENIHEVRASLLTLRNAFAALTRSQHSNHQTTSSSSSTSASVSSVSSSTSSISSSTSPSAPPLTLPNLQNRGITAAKLQAFVIQNEATYTRLEGDTRYQGLKLKSKWHKHLSSILKAANLMVECMTELNLSVLVHCSDGWDRTPELSGTAMLMLDPYYRTLEGFAVLVEKEWVSYGHKFAQRSGLGSPPAKLAAKRGDYQDSERSPVFLQWVDCVFQLIRQYPTHFEFNALFLADLVGHHNSGRFGTFLGCCRKDRVEAELTSKTMSLWTFVLSPRVRPLYINPSFQASDSKIPLTIKYEVEDLVLFMPYFLRWDSGHAKSFSLTTVDTVYDDFAIWLTPSGDQKEEKDGSDHRADTPKHLPRVGSMMRITPSSIQSSESIITTPWKDSSRSIEPIPSPRVDPPPPPPSASSRNSEIPPLKRVESVSVHRSTESSDASFSTEGGSEFGDDFYIARPRSKRLHAVDPPKVPPELKGGSEPNSRKSSPVSSPTPSPRTSDPDRVLASQVSDSTNDMLPLTPVKSSSEQRVEIRSSPAVNSLLPPRPTEPPPPKITCTHCQGKVLLSSTGYVCQNSHGADDGHTRFLVSELSLHFPQVV